jgi:hypothetical protein
MERDVVMGVVKRKPEGLFLMTLEGGKKEDGGG